jgi:hypothetical protein
MKFFGTGLLLAFNLMTVNQIAKADDGSAAWIAKCVKDMDPGEAKNASKFEAYCSCMNSKMSTDEKLSVHAWAEKTDEGKKADKECDAQVGWQK